MVTSRAIKPDAFRSRFAGAAGRVFMRHHEWELFLNLPGGDARDRLIALLEHFSRLGVANLPVNAFRQLRSDAEPQGVALYAFQASGIEVRGRKGIVDDQQAFFVVEVCGSYQAPEGEARSRGPQLELPLLSVIK